ncbi:MAG: T9SS type A sorting domain-containing protein [Sphingobacteriales bacterium]|nr:T9SS type A sorting domain-containing protein [Sphingobacteriales bacterium]
MVLHLLKLTNKNIYRTQKIPLCCCTPNPTNGYLNIPFDTKENEIAQIQIINLLGEMAYATQIDTEIGENLFTIDLSELRKGLYWVKLVSPSHSTLSKLIIKQ